MADIVNLDALVAREDFEVLPDSKFSQQIQTIQIRDLEKDCFFYSMIRKPDFQRETNEWGIGRISDFVKSFLDGDLIPAIILWQGGNNIFVIDGSHRLSSLIAWVQDDYGDGLVSKQFYDGIIPQDQTKAADKTRRLIKKMLGSYKDHQDAILHPESFPPDLVGRARRLASLALQLQWVQGDASKAEASFFKINQQAAPIDKTELRLLKSRNKANALAARAIIRSGTGHKYWSKFKKEFQDKIELESKELNNLLFTPELRTPIKTLDLPVAGRGYSSQTLPLIFDLINIANDVNVGDALIDDPDGNDTVNYLMSTKKLLNRITGTHPSSLGLHPIVYFYSNAGRYQPTAFFAIIQLIKDFGVKNQFKQFTEIRNEFENFLLKYKHFINQITLKYGSGLKGYQQVKDVFMFVIEDQINNKKEGEILTHIASDSRFGYLQPNEPGTATEVGSQFSTDTKSAAFLRDALKEPIRCGICGGLIHYNSISIDHIKRREDGGIGAIDNAQLSHPYCNTTFKN